MPVFGKTKSGLPASQRVFPQGIDQKFPDNPLGVSAAQKEQMERRLRWFQYKKRLEKNEVSIYDRRERERREEIREIRVEILKLAKAINQLDHLSGEIGQAIQQPTIKPSLYELSFWQRLRQKLSAIRKNIEESTPWLQESNKKKKKKSFWGMVNSKKGGAKTLLSSEHYVSRSAG